MHPAFHLKHLKHFSRELLPVAQAAANKSATHLERLHMRARVLSRTPTFYLPIVYANLDPSDIPGEGPAAADAATRAYRTFDLLLGIYDAPRDALKELWPRVWVWLQALEYHPATFTADREEDPFVSVLLLLGPIRIMLISSKPANQAVTAAVLATPGVPAFVARRWALLRGELHKEPARIKLLLLHDLLLMFDALPGPTFEDQLPSMAAGLDGGKREFMYMLLEGIELSVSGPDNCSSLAATLSTLIPLLEGALIAPFLRSGTSPFSDLLTMGLIRRLTKLLPSLNNAKSKDFDPNRITMVVGVLARLISMRPKYQGLDEAINAGLLLSLGRILQNRDADSVSAEVLSAFLHEIIPGATVYRDIAFAIIRRYPTIADIRSTSFRKDLRLRAAWDSLRGVIAHTAVAMTLYYENPEERICHNERCNKIQPGRDLRRCSGCEDGVYCDKECQRAAWRSGHRDVCTRGLLPRTSAERLSQAEARFVRHFVLQDYNRYKFVVLYTQLRFIHEHGANTAFVTVFTYQARTARQPLIIDVLPLSDSEFSASSFRTLARLRREPDSESTPAFTAFHLVIFGGGKSTAPTPGMYATICSEPARYELVLRSLDGGTALWEGLLAIAAKLPKYPEMILPCGICGEDVQAQLPLLFEELDALSALESQEMY
ncbi:hypothetical protein HMN09_00211600 [Mycena chlorophos]|uniref:MYND-type domain-containing protein n=1 Tax=Mycena chlorophos TaxID=658473 RepID=A0A8H6WL88_MYCCL|nr:hypothetical protein HMN09_00211600 [Mycena chlorophos]